MPILWVGAEKTGTFFAESQGPRHNLKIIKRRNSNYNSVNKPGRPAAGKWKGGGKVGVPR